MKTIAAACVLAALGLLAVPAAAQVRDTRTVPGSGVIRGVVVSDDADATPVRKARVTCGGAGLPRATTITDTQGRFEFTGLPAGRYSIAASKPTWVTTNYGAKQPQRPGRPLPLAAGGTAAIVVRLARGAVITGVLLDHDNQPASGALVRALQYRIANGERRLVTASDATTDDRGAYRIYGLAAGDYFVSAAARGLGGMRAGEVQLTADADVRDDGAAATPAVRTVAFAPAYFPNGTSVSQAATLSLRPGEERTGIDFTLQLVPTARVEGSVSLAGGDMPAAIEVNLVAVGPTATPGLPFDNYRPTRPAADGTFAFNGVPPGQYTLEARVVRPITLPNGAAAPPQKLWASMQIAVDGEPLSGLTLALEPALSIAGRVRFPPASLAPPALETIRISAEPYDPEMNVAFVPPAVPVEPDGRFTITGVMPGRYRLNVRFPGLARAGGWYVDTITADGQDAFDAALTIQPNMHVLDALVTFTDRVAQVSGIARAAGNTGADATVVLFPEDQRSWLPHTRRIQATRVAADGAYTIRGIPPGRYLVALAEDAEPDEWFDPAFLQRLRPTARPITIRAADAVVVDLIAPSGAPPVESRSR